MASPRHPLRLFGKIRRSSSAMSPTCYPVGYRSIHGPQKPDEYTDVPEYPSIDPARNRDEAELAKLQNLFKSMRTTEEKQLYLNKPKYYGWRTHMMNPEEMPAGSLDMIQYATHTTIVDGKLPDIFDSIDEKAAEEAKRLEPLLKAYISKLSNVELAIEVPGEKVPFQEPYGFIPDCLVKEAKEKHLVCGIHRFLKVHLSKDYEHLRSWTTDNSGRNEAFWMRSGFLPNKRMIDMREGDVKYREKHRIARSKSEEDAYINSTFDRNFQIINNAIVQTRSSKMMRPYLNVNDEICRSGLIPKANFDPKIYGFHVKHQHGVNIPAVWQGSSSPYTNLMFVTANNKLEVMTNGSKWAEDAVDVSTSKAVMSAFSVAMSTSLSLGADPMGTDPERPIVTNVVVSDGKTFKMAAFQLNKTALVVENIDDSTRNVLWHLNDRKLFVGVDEETGDVVGFDVDVLRDLIKFYIVDDYERVDDFAIEKLIDIKNDYNRSELHTNLHRVYSRRPRHFPRPTIELWERIYRIRHPNQTFMIGNRHMPWFIMHKYDHMGRHHWHPTYRHLDYYNPRYKIRKDRQFKGDNKWPKVFPPLPRDDEK